MAACGGGTAEHRTFTCWINHAKSALIADTLKFAEGRFVFSALTLRRSQCYNSASKRRVYESKFRTEHGGSNGKHSGGGGDVGRRKQRQAD